MIQFVFISNTTDSVLDYLSITSIPIRFCPSVDKFAEDSDDYQGDAEDVFLIGDIERPNYRKRNLKSVQQRCPKSFGTLKHPSSTFWHQDRALDIEPQLNRCSSSYRPNCLGLIRLREACSEETG